MSPPLKSFTLSCRLRHVVVPFLSFFESLPNVGGPLVAFIEPLGPLILPVPTFAIRIVDEASLTWLARLTARTHTLMAHFGVRALVELEGYQRHPSMCGGSHLFRMFWM